MKIVIHSESLHKTDSTHFLASYIRCRTCNGSVTLNGNYYGCCNTSKKTCKNKLLIPKKEISRMIVSDLQEKFLNRINLSSECLSKWYYVIHTSIQTLAFLNRKNKRRK